MSAGDGEQKAGVLPSGRRRNAAATREAILRSALIAFTRSGYDGVGVREIAQAAGVTAMLVNRYFGTKERLFAEVVEVAFARRPLLGDTDDVGTLGRGLAAALVTQEAPEGVHIDGFLLMLRSVSNVRAAEILREGVERHFERYLVHLLPGARAGERAGLLLSLIAGFQLMRNVLGSVTLAEADPAALSDRLEALIRLLAEPDQSPAGPDPDTTGAVPGPEPAFPAPAGGAPAR
jgi:AcrR family transcriptional regulator